MTDFAVGDLQGCLNPLVRLLERAHFNPKQDRLYATGDLVNRGPQSLETLRFCKSLGNAFHTVLGNHDLHLLAIARGIRQPTVHDTLDAILVAQDRSELLEWLQAQPLLVTLGEYSIVHAGIPPNWRLAQAQQFAAEVSQVLCSEQSGAYFKGMYGDAPDRWCDSLEGPARWRLITNYLTRMCYCTAGGQLNLQDKTAPQVSTEIASGDLAPWFSHTQRKTRKDKIIFGHWAALEGRDCGKNLFPLDTGYVWGGSMRLMNLDTGEYIHEVAPPKAR